MVLSSRCKVWPVHECEPQTAVEWNSFQEKLTAWEVARPSTYPVSTIPSETKIGAFRGWFTLSCRGLCLCLLLTPKGTSPTLCVQQLIAVAEVWSTMPLSWGLNWNISLSYIVAVSLNIFFHRWIRFCLLFLPDLGTGLVLTGWRLEPNNWWWQSIRIIAEGAVIKLHH